MIEYCPDHPQADKRGMVRQHRLVMECMVGRILDRSEVVHHRNKNRADNHPSNLMLLPNKSDHGREHGEETRIRSTVSLTEEQVQTALEGRTTAQASQKLGVHHMTLRNRFGHLLKKRRSPGSEFPPAFVARVRELAADPRVSTREAQRLTGVTAETIRQCCLLHGISWNAALAGTPSHRSYKEACALRSRVTSQQAL